MESAVSFESELPTKEEFTKRIIETLQDYPWLVAEDNTGVLGHAYASRYRTRVAYQWHVETSVYVKEGQYRSGVGRKLYQELIALLKKQNFTTAYAVITLPNESSVKFHEAMGFDYLCTYPKVGFKLGQWHDVGRWSLSLNPTDGIPAFPVPFAGFS